MSDKIKIEKITLLPITKMSAQAMLIRLAKERDEAYVRGWNDAIEAAAKHVETVAKECVMAGPIHVDGLMFEANHIRALKKPSDHGT